MDSRRTCTVLSLGLSWGRAIVAPHNNWLLFHWWKPMRNNLGWVTFYSTKLWPLGYSPPDFELPEALSYYYYVGITLAGWSRESISPSNRAPASHKVDREFVKTCITSSKPQTTWYFLNHSTVNWFQFKKYRRRWNLNKKKTSTRP